MAGKMKKCLGAFLIAFLFFIPTLTPAAGPLKWEDSSAVSFERLSDKDGLHSDLFILPLTLKRSFDRFDLSVTLPYIFRSGNTAVSVVNGWAFRTGARTGLRGSDNGFGDAVFEGNFYLLDEEKDSPISLTLTGNVKAPLAPKSRGLGTGKFDEGLGFRFDKDLGESWVVSAGADYTFIGRIPEARLKDVFSFDAGLFRKFTERLVGVISYEQSTPLLAGTRSFRDVTMGLNFRATKTDSVFLGGTIETASNPDYGITLAFSSRF
jgi:outer membrane putative beta-barrel porin/alpha-amylase